MKNAEEQQKKKYCLNNKADTDIQESGNFGYQMKD